MKAKYDLICFCDGVSKNNPGEAGIGVVLCDGKYSNYPENNISGLKVLNEISEYIGRATNNVAEYSALVKALNESLKLKAKNILVFTDSELIVKQIKGEYKTDDLKLKLLRDKVYNLIKNFSKCNIIHIPREKNKLADKLANLGVKYYNKGLKQAM